MGKHHEPFQALGPVEWQSVPQDSLDQFVGDIFSETQTVIESIPAPSTKATSVGRARSKTESAVDSSEVQRAFAQRQQGASVDLSEDLRKEWKEIKVGPKENPLGINVYKLGSKDGRGAWFARRSIHEGLSFDKWKQGLEMEFGETMKVQGSPGSGNIRGIGADKRVESRDIDGSGKLQVYQLSAQFPGPTSPRDFVTLLLTSESSAKPADGSRPLRQFMIISKPCEHSECPPRQGIIRGYYESVELVREVPLGTLGHKRSLSSADLGKDDARARSTGPSSDTRSENEDIAPMAIEWLMVTRSDPGGSVPRFLIEKGTPPGICGDAGKFLKWVTAKSVQGFPPINEDGIPEDDEEPSEAKREEGANPQSPPINHVNRVVTHHYQGEEQVPSSSGLYGILAGAISAASSYVPASFLRSWASNSDAGSTEDNSSEVPPLKDTYAAVDSSSDTSSVRSFASALERSVAQEKSPESIAESQSETSRSNQTIQQDKELKKLQERRRKLDEKVAKLEKRRNEKLVGEKEKDATTMAKLRERHEKEVAKKEEKYKRELRKLEEKREVEQRKAEERRRKATEKEEKANLTMELDKMKTERDLARKEIQLLETQVGELQAQNTMLVRKLGKLGLIEESDSTPSLSSTVKPETKGSPLVS